MNIDNALTFTKGLIENHTKKPLNDSQVTVLKGCLEGKLYREIDNLYNFSEDYSKEIGSDLWKILSEALGVRVTKTNLRTVIEQHLPLEKQKISDSAILPKCNDELRDFVGRDAAITDINNLVNQEDRKIIIIQAAGGVGKTTLAKQYLTQFDLVLPLEMAKDKENITAVESVVEEWLKQYFQEEPGREFGITLSRLKLKLQNRKVGVFIDNLEPALDKQGRLIEKHNLYVELLRVLADENVQSLTLITSRERLCDDRVSGTFHYHLAVLTVEAWADFFTFRKIKIDPPSLEAMHKIYGGNAKAMDILLGVMRTDYDGDMSAYWQENCTLVETELKNLVESQFKRLQTLDTEAYKLLCRLGCFRYQDVPRVSVDALLALLWDIPEEKQRDVIKSLRNRCLVEFEKCEYWLHPVIREQGIERLKASGEWEEVNRKAAGFWNQLITDIKSVSDCNKKLETYYHYVNIQDWNSASEVLVQDVNCSYLIPQLRNFGYTEKCLSILYFIRDKPMIQNNIKSDLWACSADLHCITSKLKLAISEYKTSINLLQKCPSGLNIEYYIENMGTLAFTYMNLGEYSEAINIFMKIKPTAQSIGDSGKQFLVYIYSCLSTIYLYIDDHELSLKYLNNAIDLQINLEKSNLTWIRRCGLYYLIISLTFFGQIDEAIELCNNLFNYSEKNFYPHDKAFSLCGFGQIYRYKNMLLESSKMFKKSLIILREIGATYDLAEAYYQLGLTYQKMGETENSHTNFNEAIRLFNEMEAPKQVEKVEKAKIGNIS
ncbi:NB-ARC domain-containing protein [Nodularia sp. UHCC 0506]|uniref:tetratricopeptide repeat protein n=1 Tax=Nodularia sp. UHCC 0506 TaxID=3110243 RepID=UPI002B20C79C|nr:NB-ARC domain-containing protein [Nodularia sp. UHCC 0506]MEA5516428.1 NB-ARC domain-containing protein [Nodularia sp. UHCC 0506]